MRTKETHLLSSTPTPFQGDNLLNQALNHCKPACFYLKNGIRLVGYIIAFDNETVLLKSTLVPHSLQLIYKHAMTTFQAGSVIAEPKNVL